MKKSSRFEVLAIDGIQAAIAVVIPLALYSLIEETEFAKYSIIIATYSITSGVQGALYLGGMKLDILSLDRKSLSHLLSSVLLLGAVLSIIGTIAVSFYFADSGLLLIILPFIFLTLSNEVLFVYYTAVYSRRVLVLIKPIRSIIILLTVYFLVRDLWQFFFISVVINGLFSIPLIIKLPFDARINRLYRTRLGQRRVFPILLSLAVPQIPILISGGLLGIQTTNILKGLQLVVSTVFKVQASLNNLFVPQIKRVRNMSVIFKSYLQIYLPASVIVGMIIFGIIYFEFFSLLSLLKLHLVALGTLFCIMIFGGITSLLAWRSLGDRPYRFLAIQLSFLLLIAVLMLTKSVSLYFCLVLLIGFNSVINVLVWLFEKFLVSGK